MITQAEIILPKYQHELKMAVTLPRWGKKKKEKKVSPQISQSFSETYMSRIRQFNEK
jgi:hypothetical protein